MEGEATAKRLRRGHGSSTCTRVISMWIPAILGKMIDSQANMQVSVHWDSRGKVSLWQESGSTNGHSTHHMSGTILGALCLFPFLFTSL